MANFNARLIPSKLVLAIFILLSTLILNLPLTQAADSSTNTSAQSAIVDDPLVGWKSAENNSGAQASKIRIETIPENQKARTNAVYELCRSFDEEPCLEADSKPTLVSVILPRCMTNIETWCIEEIAISKRGRTPAPAKFIRQVQGVTTPENQNMFYPRGSTISLWEASDIYNAGGTNTYAAFVQVTMARFPEYMKKEARPGARLSVSIMPFKEIGNLQSPNQSGYKGISLTEVAGATGGKKFQLSGGDIECVWTEDGKCGLPVDFAEDSFASISLRLRNDLTGWLMGRMQDPRVKIEKLDGEFSRLIVSANSVTIPKLNVSIPKRQLTQKLRDSWTEDGYGITDPNGIYTLRSDDSGIFEIIDSWREIARDTSFALGTAWNFNSITGGGGSPCLQNPNGLQGIVSTNAMGYEGIAPSYGSGTLNYQVAGFHFNPDGSEFVGSYDLLINRKIADCLYKLKNMPVSATVSIVDDGKITKLSSSKFAEISVGNASWFKVSVQGFTFSAPQVRVSFAHKPKILICVKGLTVKKVTGSAPKCPVGFRKNGYSTS